MCPTGSDWLSLLLKFLWKNITTNTVPNCIYNFNILKTAVSALFIRKYHQMNLFFLFIMGIHLTLTDASKANMNHLDDKLFTVCFKKCIFLLVYSLISEKGKVSVRIVIYYSIGKARNITINSP